MPHLGFSRQILPIVVAGGLLLAPLSAAAQNSAASGGFNWLANGATASAGTPSDEAIRRTREALTKARGLAHGATWVCSPAGFGQPSRCHRG